MDAEPRNNTDDAKTVVFLDPTSSDGEAALLLLGENDRHISLVTLLGHSSAQVIREFAEYYELDVGELAAIYLDLVARRLSSDCDRIVETVVSGGRMPAYEVQNLVAFDSVARVLLPRSLVGTGEGPFRKILECLGVPVHLAGTTVGNLPHPYVSRHLGKRFSARVFDLPSMSEVPRGELLALDKLTTCVTVDSDEVLIRRDNQGQQCLVVVDGVLTVERDGAVVAELGSGQCAGELALLTGAPCNADVRAATDATVLVMNQEEFAIMLDDCPTVASRVLRNAARRLAAA
ncbi:MAG: cyclic nucleotide-binding domain-containing protein [Acidimicrobiia bacterium]|nr:cyclic nucleotide-binding domain-containing protein [Acidimicrobiia bacterium]